MFCVIFLLDVYSLTITKSQGEIIDQTLPVFCPETITLFQLFTLYLFERLSVLKSHIHNAVRLLH